MWEPEEFERHWLLEFPGGQAPHMDIQNQAELEAELAQSKERLRAGQQQLAQQKFKVIYLQTALERLAAKTEPRGETLDKGEILDKAGTPDNPGTLQLPEGQRIHPEHTGYKCSRDSQKEKQNNPEQGEENLGQGETDLGQGEENLGQGETDLGQGEENLGQGETDPGQGETDPGQGEEDRGQGETDPGQGETDPGQGEEDLGQGETDPGQGEEDLGQGETDPGQEETDPGQEEHGDSERDSASPIPDQHGPSGLRRAQRVNRLWDNGRTPGARPRFKRHQLLTVPAGSKRPSSGGSDGYTSSEQEDGSSADFNYTDGYDGDTADEPRATEEASETMPFIDESPTMSPQLSARTHETSDALSSTPDGVAAMSAVDPEKRLEMRNFVLSGILASEEIYLNQLEALLLPLKPLKAAATTSQPVLTNQQIETIFYKVQEIHQIHREFCDSLCPKIQNWDSRHSVGHLFQKLVNGRQGRGET
ncbi:uncharacterized protein LOC144676266, partial [Cetorhinus maximus]